MNLFQIGADDDLRISVSTNVEEIKQHHYVLMFMDFIGNQWN